MCVLGAGGTEGVEQSWGVHHAAGVCRVPIWAQPCIQSQGRVANEEAQSLRAWRWNARLQTQFRLFPICGGRVAAKVASWGTLHLQLDEQGAVQGPAGPAAPRMPPAQPVADIRSLIIVCRLLSSGHCKKEGAQADQLLP